MNKEKYINIKKYELEKSNISEENKIQTLVLLYDILSNSELIFLLKKAQHENDDILIECILTILYKRSNKDYSFIFIHYLMNGSKRTRFLSLMFLNEMGLLKNKTLQREFLDKEKDSELINLFNMVNDIKHEDYSINEIKDYILSNFKCNDIHTQLDISFKIKNITFQGKKETISNLLYRNDDYSVIQNLLYALCTEELDEIEKKNINTILSKKEFYSELIHDLKMLNLYSPVHKYEYSLFKRCASLVAAIFS